MKDAHEWLQPNGILSTIPSIVVAQTRRLRVKEATFPPGYGTVTPWILSPDSAALVFLETAFDAAEIEGSRMLNQDGAIVHVEVRIGRSIVMLFDSRARIPAWLIPPSHTCRPRTTSRA
jgi:hypothetical protein